MATTSPVAASLTRFISAAPSVYPTLTTVVQTLRDLLTVRVFSSAFAVLLTIRFMRTRAWLAGTGFFPGKWQIMSPLFPYPFLPEIPYVCMDPFWWMRLKHKPFADLGSDVMTGASLFPVRVSAIVADAVALKEINRNKTVFPKPTELLKFLNVFGVNIVTSDGADYRRHRNPVQGSFTEPNNRLVWDTTCELVQRLFESNGWRGKEAVAIDETRAVTIRLALHVLGTAIFGQPIASDDRKAIIPPGHTMSFEDAIDIAASNLVTIVLYPKWMRRLTSNLRRVDAAKEDLMATARELIAERRLAHASGTDDGRTDTLSALIRAADSEDDPKQRLTDDEIVADVVAFLIAGHETTAHAVALTLGMLALYPEEQNCVYQQIQEYAVDGLPKYEHLNKLTRCLAVLNETLRLYPPNPRLGKRAAVDAQIPLAFPTPSGQTSVPVPAGTIVVTHLWALHYNPRYWPDPYTFRADRFLDPAKPWNRDAFQSFSGGARMCLGRRFAETESIAIIASFLTKYRVELPAELDKELENEGLDAKSVLGDGEKEMKRRDRVIRCRQGLTLAPLGLKLVFRRRAHT